MLIVPASKVFVPLLVKRIAVKVPDNAIAPLDQEPEVVLLYAVQVAIHVFVAEFKSTIDIVATVALAAVEL